MTEGPADNLSIPHWLPSVNPKLPSSLYLFPFWVGHKVEEILFFLNTLPSCHLEDSFTCKGTRGYGLNCYAPLSPHNWYSEILIPKVMHNNRWSHWKVSLPWWQSPQVLDIALIKEATEHWLDPSTTWYHSQKTPSMDLEGAILRQKSALDFRPPSLWRNTVCGVQATSHGTLT